MPLASGTQVGPYQISSLIGKGGMGEVYRARDTTLKRDVALKVLPSALNADHDRIARFQREAEVLAQLDHPNIAPIFGMIESDGTRALALALIEGPTLAEQIEAGPIPREEALAIAKQIIDALEYAHDRGVVHRDLKPANVKINSDGVVKVLDFGLAKVLEDEAPKSAPATSPTLTLGHTRAGMILGTAAYMSPEQAVGRPVDRRSDIFSFGAVLYEMLTGERAFAGTSTPDVLEAVVKADPDWGKLPPQSPERLLRRCLVKDRKQRLQAIGEARIALQSPVEEEEPGVAPSRSRLGVAVWATLATIVATIALWGWLKPRPAGPRPVTRFIATLAQPKGAQNSMPVLSHDGRSMAYLAGNQIYLRSLDEFESRPIPGTEGASLIILPRICFSPDGQWIAFSTSNITQLRKVPVTGGAALTLTDGQTNLGPCDWAGDGRIYSTSQKGLIRLSESGGAPETILAIDAEKQTAVSSQVLPGGSLVLFTVISASDVNDAKVALFNLETRETKTLLENAGVASYAPTGPNSSSGHILYARNGSLFAASFDLKSLRVGSRVPVLNGIQTVGPIGFFGISDSGTLAYFTGGAGGTVTASGNTPVWLNREGVEQALSFPARPASELRLSPDGGRAVGGQFNPQSLSADLWIYEFAGSHLTPVTFGQFGQLNGSAVWTPDGKRLIYWSTASPVTGNPGEIRSVPADHSGPPTTILASPTPLTPSSISPDGKLLLAEKTHSAGGGRANGGEVWLVALDPASSEKPRAFLQSQKFDQVAASFSPNGHWVMYDSNASGRFEVYVVPFPGPAGETQVSVDGGVGLGWNRNGRELYYLNGRKIMAVDVQTSPTFRAGTPRMLFETNAGVSVRSSAADGSRFLATKNAAGPDAGPEQSNEVHVVLNWFEELRQRVK